MARRRLIDGLCSNLSVLSVSVQALIGARNAAALAAPSDSAADQAAQQDPGGASLEQEILIETHRSALRAYLYLLHSIVQQLEKVGRGSSC